MALTRKQLTPEAALARAEALCARAEHASSEIRDKLRRWGMPTALAEQIIDRLIKTRFLDDTRFAAAFVHDRVRYARWGRRKIAAALWAKGIDASTAREALDEIDPDEYSEALQTVIAAKRRSTPDADTPDGRQKIFRHALSRGFESELIANHLRK